MSRLRRASAHAAATLGAAMLAGAAVDALLYALARRGIAGPRVTPCSKVANGVRGHYLESNEQGGSITVILASPLVRARSYLRLLRIVGEHRRAIVVEMPGSGAAARLRESWGREEYAAWVSGFLAALDLDDVTLVGHSNSGAIALDVAASDPRIQHVVVADSIGARARHGVARVVAARIFDGFLEPLLDLRGWWHLLYNAIVHTRSFARNVLIASYDDILPVASRITIPTTIVWGRFDGTMPVDGARRLKACIPHAVVVLLAASHDGIVTRPRLFAREALLSPRAPIVPERLRNA